MLINILSNAIKFTKDGGTIRFEVKDQPVGDGKHVEVHYRISDTGIGMSEEYQKHLYEEFSQESDGARTNYKGTGLGMAITKRYVDMTANAFAEDIAAAHAAGMNGHLAKPIDIDEVMKVICRVLTGSMNMV